MNTTNTYLYQVLKDEKTTNTYQYQVLKDEDSTHETKTLRLLFQNFGV